MTTMIMVVVVMVIVMMTTRMKFGLPRSRQVTSSNSLIHHWAFMDVVSAVWVRSWYMSIWCFWLSHGLYPQEESILDFICMSLRRHHSFTSRLFILCHLLITHVLSTVFSLAVCTVGTKSIRDFVFFG